MIGDHRVALVLGIFNSNLFTHQLLVASAFDVASVILVEISKFVVDVDRSWNIFLDSNLLGANVTHAVCGGAHSVVLKFDHLNSVGHDIQRDSKGQEDHTEDNEDSHGAAVAGNRAPSWQHLLFEFRLF